MTRNDIFAAIIAERNYQDNKWGSDDYLNTVYNWATYIGGYTNRSLIGVAPTIQARQDAFKADMIKVAALAVAAIENL